jgi:uncharacterized protein (DUF1499 family)
LSFRPLPSLCVSSLVSISCCNLSNVVIAQRRPTNHEIKPLHFVEVSFFLFLSLWF